MAFKKLVLLLCLGLFLAFNSQAQSTLTFKQCVEFAAENSLYLKKTSLEVDKNNEKEKEVLSNYAPQINGSVGFNDNLLLPTTILPGAFVNKPGQTIAVRMGSQYNFTAGFTASQMLYNQTMLVAIKAAKASETLAELSVEKAKQQLIFDVSSAYYAVQVTHVQKDIVESNLNKIKKLQEVTRLQYENGLAKKTDYDRLVVNQTNLQTEFDNISQTLDYQNALLKFFMGMNLDSNLVIAKMIEPSTLQLNAPQNSVVNNIDYKIIDEQKELNELNIKQFYAGYFPSLNANASYNWQNLSNEVHLVGDQAKWYNNAMVGVTLTVPVFDGLNKHYKATQAKIQQEQLDLDALYLTESLHLQNMNAYNKLKSNQAAVLVQEKNMKLSEEIYTATQEQYNGGLLSLSELLNAETALKESQNNYLRALVQVKLAELELMKASGNIESIVK